MISGRAARERLPSDATIAVADHGRPDDRLQDLLLEHRNLAAELHRVLDGLDDAGGDLGHRETLPRATLDDERREHERLRPGRLGPELDQDHRDAPGVGSPHELLVLSTGVAGDDVDEDRAARWARGVQREDRTLRGSLSELPCELLREHPGHENWADRGAIGLLAQCADDSSELAERPARTRHCARPG